MSFVPRAFLFGEAGGFFSNLRDVIYRLGLRNTGSLRSAGEIAELLGEGVWPIIIVDGTDDGGRDSFAAFERLYCRPGFELFSYVLVAGADDRAVITHAVSMGAKGAIRKPIHPTATLALMSELVPKIGDPVVEAALATARLMIVEKKFDAARSSLQALSGQPGFERAAEVALLRIEGASGHFSRAEERLQRLLKRYPGELRFLCEAADYMGSTTQLHTAIRFLKAIDDQNAIWHRTWELGVLALEVNDLDLASKAFEDLARIPGYREHALMAMSRMMMFFGLSEYLPQLLKPYPYLTKEFTSYVNKTRKVAV